MIRLPRKAQRNLNYFTIIAFIYLSLWYIILPLDSPIRLAIYFNASRLRNAVRTDRDAWLKAPATHPLDLTTDIGYLIKTGYGTRHRVPAQLEAYRQSGDLLGQQGQSFLVVGDWTTVNETDASLIGAEVHDALKLVLEHKLGPKYANSPRFVKHRRLQDAIDSNDEEEANALGRRFGWELDALKFVLGMDLLFHEMPKKKWYIILDDDTYLVRPSLELLLSRLDPEEPLYIGNAVGDYRGRFAHGGSAVIISGEAMRRLFSRTDVVNRAYRNSLDETWGDKLVATTFQKVGVYLDERYNHHFNGEPPAITRIAADRFCSPIVSFHSLREPGDMARIGRVLGRQPNPVLWGQVWDLFTTQPISRLDDQLSGATRDHVGEPDITSRQFDRVETAEDCMSRCEKDKHWCLAWKFLPNEERCITSPWLVIGESGTEGSLSGVRRPRFEALSQGCS